MESKIDEFINLLINVFPKEEIPEPGPDNQRIRQEAEKIKFELIRQFCTMDDKEKQRLFVHNFNARLVYLDDYFFGIMEKSNLENQDMPEENLKMHYLRQSVLPVLDDLLAFVREQFSSWCSEQQKIPERLRRSFTREITETLDASCFPVADPEHDLLKKVKDSIRHRLTEDHAGVTYGLMNYLHTFLENVNRIQTGKQEHALLTALTDLLIAINFNEVAVMEDMVSGIRKEAEKIGSVKEQIEYLNGRLKKVNQIPFRPGCLYNEQNESVSFFLGNWIKAEILFLEKSLQLFSNPFYPPGFQGTPSGYKVHLDLSVAQMACLLRLLVECNIVKSDSAMELFNFLAQHFQSKKQENISAESVRVQFYHVTESTREEIHKVVLRLLKKASLPI